MTHYIRTIHTSFTSGLPPSAPPSWSSSTAYAGTSAQAHSNLLTNLSGIMHSRYPPGLGHSDWRSTSSASNGPTPTPYTKRRSSITIRPPSSRRPAPLPPSPRTQPASLTSMRFDPFSDDNSCAGADAPVLYHTPTPVAARSPSPQRTTRPATLQYHGTIPPAPPAPSVDRDARSRLVAGILLNRVHAVGKPMRGRRPGTEPREYVRSGLSRVVSVEA